MAEAPLNQTFTVSTPGDHVLTWYYKAAIGVAGTPYDVIINGPSSYTLPVNSVLGRSTWRAQSLPINLATGSYQLLFRPRPGAGVTLLDTVSLVEEDSPAKNPPVAVINVSKDADLDEGNPGIILISVNGVDAPVTLDGSMSSDPDGDTLFHSWSLGVTGEPIVNTRLPIGMQTVSLEVSDERGGGYALSLFLIDRVGRAFIARFKQRFGFERLDDVGAIPVFLLMFNVLLFLTSPILNAHSRYNEPEADRFALEITRNPQAAGQGFVKLQTGNLGVPYPYLIDKFWRHSHPPLGERIEFANTYRPWATGKAGRYDHLFTNPELAK